MALTEALHHFGVRRVAVLTSYVRSLTETVCDYIRHEGLDVVDSISLEIANNLAVGRLGPGNLVDRVDRVDTSDADTLILSACVQMPSLPVLDAVQQRYDIRSCPPRRHGLADPLPARTRSGRAPRRTSAVPLRAPSSSHHNPQEAS